MSDRSGSRRRPLWLIRSVLRAALSWTYGVLSWGAGRIRDAAVSLRSPAVRESVLIGTAYVTGLVGLTASIAGDPTDPETQLGTIGIGLMGVSFVCLFVVSVSILRATGGTAGEE